MTRGRLPSITGRAARGAEWRPSPDEAVTLRALPAPPSHFPATAKTHYALLISALARRKAIERVDVALIEEAASAYAEYARLDAEIQRDGKLLSESAKGGRFLSGEAQARAHCWNRYIKATAHLGIGSPAARMQVFGHPESNEPSLFAWAESDIDDARARPGSADPTDPFGDMPLH